MGFEAVTVAQGEVSVTAVPARGALVSALRVLGREVLYLDRATLDDPAKNVRGGIPILFPYAGKLEGGKFLPAGTTMPQHGFGRNKAWRVGARAEGVLRMTLEDDAETRAVYPYDFTAEQSLVLLPRGVLVELLVTNRGTKPMPVSPGWHPYFTCTAAKKGEVRGDVEGLTAGRLGNEREFDFGLAAPVLGRACFTVPGLGTLRLAFAPEMRHLQFWSQPGKDFICIEPFWGPNNTVNTERRDEVKPGQCRAYWMRIEVEA